MNVIENFAELSFEEQKKFAEAFIKTINSEHTFTSEVDFEVTGVEASDLTGGLIIMLEHDDLIDVSRKAAWTCKDEDEIDSDPGYNADYDNYLFEDAKKAFKTLSATIEGYAVSLEIDDVNEEETVDVKVENYSHENAGIGSYEYFGFVGHDSRPYVEVEGTIIKACTCYLTLYIEPIDEPAVEPEEE